jgi:hypothetical protein
MTDRIIIQKKPPKSGAAAGILSGLFPGIGQIYNGQYGKGILFMAIFIGLITMQPHHGQPFQGLLLAGFYIFQVIEAVQAARQINGLAPAENGGAAAPPPTPAPEAPARSGSVFWGAALMVIGALFLLANFEIIDYDRIFQFWPVLVIVIGLKMIADYFSRKSA